MGSKAKAARLMRPTCPIMAACDGTVLTGFRAEAGLCNKCEEHLKKRGKSIPPRGTKVREWTKEDEKHV